uniref:Integrase catalytic domain-containing protein n=1 Tax=Strongyloides venezuelensis TaxID=75913 RepID=A0A0K0F276_STRVS
MNEKDKIVSTMVPSLPKRKKDHPTKESKAVKSAEMINLLRRENEKEIICLSHDIQNHFGYSKTKSSIESRNICQRRNIAVRMIPESKNVDYESPGQNMSIDIMGPISPTAFDRSKHVLCAIDTFSRYCYIISLKSCTTEKVTQALYNQVFCYHSMPKSIKNDGTKYFTSYDFEQFLKSLNIEHQVSSTYRSRGNCLVEHQFLSSYSSGIFDKNKISYDLLEAAAIIRQQSKEFNDVTRQVLTEKSSTEELQNTSHKIKY